MTNGKLLVAVSRSAQDGLAATSAGLATAAVWFDWIERGLGLVALGLTIAVLIYRLRINRREYRGGE